MRLNIVAGISKVALLLLFTTAILLSFAWVTRSQSFAQSPVPEVPYTPIQYPGANFQALACKPGPPIPHESEIDQRVQAFIADVQHGISRPRYLYRYFPVDSLRGSTRFLMQTGPVDSLQFLRGNIGCARELGIAKISPRYYPTHVYHYRVIGERGTLWLRIAFRDRRVSEFRQEGAP